MRTRSPRAGGLPLALLIVAGVLIGDRLGQPTLGLFAGLAAGLLVALLIWRADRRTR